ncbi:MAG: nucleoside 2-deoxyribosyltransferase domain-containing protein [Pirellulaceae bacterium]|nr:nucleoside 2-deoxyribosyltransferase domain-containing protein [Pirellulaceae bacterium]
MARVLKPPTGPQLQPGETSLFLAGSIEQGVAEEWQRRVELALADLPVAIFNPRRQAWDATWVQSIDIPQFRGQVEWELAALERADVIGMYFAPTSKAPITLLELGLFARSGKLVVCCPAGFWRKGNVEVVCARYGVPLVSDFADFVAQLRNRLGNFLAP